jgi:peroxiredoxin Q/BCP
VPQETIVPRANTLLHVGVPAPDFTLNSATGELVRLSALQGQKVALFFFRGSWCATCRVQLAQLRDHYDEYPQLQTRILGVTTQRAETMAEYCQAEGIRFPILIDPARLVTKQYDVYNLITWEGINMPHNATFLIDSTGIIRFVHVSIRSTDVPDEATLRATLAAME